MKQFSSFEVNYLKSSVRSKELFKQFSPFGANCLQGSVRSEELFQQFSSFKRTFRTVHQM